ncbi:hypothetical protein ACI6Q2_14010 [Chitinophagaceae bacterium LWZ2-11]
MFYRSVGGALFTLLFCAFFFSCKRKTKPELAFYHWSVNPTYNYQLFAQKQNTVKELKPSALFVKIMDIDWDNIYEAYPSTTFSFENLSTSLGDSIVKSLHLIPAIFITNKALEKTDSSKIPELARKIVLKTDQLVKGRRKYDAYTGEKLVIDSNIHYNELQLDCDWTAGTQKKYFALLTNIKKLLPHNSISSTLRLHQYKYPTKTGVPPVDEVYLMCYNTGDVKKPEEKNSIFDYQKAKPYFEHISGYPKKLNFALPAFSWCVIFKDNKFYKIDNNIDVSFFSDAAATQKYDQNNLYQILTDTVINNNFLRRGDLIKWEHLSDADMQQAADLCARAANSENFRVVFYDLDHINTNNYETIHKAFNRFNF